MLRISRRSNQLPSKQAPTTELRFERIAGLRLRLPCEAAFFILAAGFTACTLTATKGGALNTAAR